MYIYTDFRFRSNLRVRIIRLRWSIPHDLVSKGLPSSQCGRGVLLSTHHCDSEAFVKRYGQGGRKSQTEKDVTWRYLLFMPVRQTKGSES